MRNAMVRLVERPGFATRGLAVLVIWTSAAMMASAAGAAANSAGTHTANANDATSQTAATLTGIVNKICPVLTDEEIDPSIAPVEYNGMRVGFCCNNCRRKFLQDPDKYVANLKVSLETGSTPPAATAGAEEKSTVGPLAPHEHNTDSDRELSADHSQGTEDPAGGQALSPSEKVFEFIGKFHVLVIHFPIAFLLGAALAEFIGLFTAGPFWRGAGRYCSIFGAAGAVAAACLGWIDAVFMPHPEMQSILTLHRWFGTATAVVAVAAVVFLGLFRSRKQPGLRSVYLALLFAAAILVVITGHFGGSLIYGANYFASGAG